MEQFYYVILIAFEFLIIQKIHKMKISTTHLTNLFEHHIAISRFCMQLLPALKYFMHSNLIMFVDVMICKRKIIIKQDKISFYEHKSK